MKRPELKSMLLEVTRAYPSYYLPSARFECLHLHGMGIKPRYPQ